MSIAMRMTLRLLLLLVLACSPSDPLDEIRVLHASGRFTESLDRLRKLGVLGA